MATRSVLHRNLHRVFSNVTIPNTSDVNNAIIQVLSMLFTQYCRRVDAGGDCVVVPALPATDFKSGDKYVDEVVANAYVSDDFAVALRYPKTDLLIAKLRQNVVIPIVGFYIDSPSHPLLHPLPVARIDIYRDKDKKNLWKSASTILSNNVAMTSRGVVVMLPEPIVVGPGDEVAIEVVMESLYTPDKFPNVRATIAWLPPVVFTSRSLFLASPATES